MRSVILVLVALAACGAPLPPPAPDWVLRPTSVSRAELPAFDVALPATAQKAFVAVTPQHTVVGTDVGLFTLAPQGLAAVDAQPVTGVLAAADGRVLLARDGKLHEWADGVLRRSQLDVDVTRLHARRGAGLWLSRPSVLLRFEAGALSSVAVDGEVVALGMSARSPHFVAATASSRALFRPAGAGFEQQPLDDELEGLTAAVPFGEDRVLALDTAGRLWSRLTVEAGTVWRRVALTDAQEDPGASGLTHLAVDPETGAVWAAGGGALYRLQGGDVMVQTATAAPQGLQVSEGGLVWAKSGGVLRRYGRTAPVRFSESVAPLAQRHCRRCHQSGRQGTFALVTAADWAGRIDAILAAVSPPARMPADSLSALSETERALIRQWKEDGLRE